jgi:hypothetical protein
LPRNGSGVYTVPAADNPAVPNTLIESTKFNNTMTDIASAMSMSIASDGQTTVTASIPLNNNKLTGVAPGTARTDAATLANIQDKTGVYVATVGGTADVITLTPSPAITAYAAGQEFSFIASGANTTNVTVAISGLAAKAVTKNGTTALVAGDLPSGARVSIWYDGTRFQIGTLGAGTAPPDGSVTTAKLAAGVANGLTTVTALSTDHVVIADASDSGNVKKALISDITALIAARHSPIRQTVLNGPVDTSGFSAFGGATGATTVTASGTLTLTAANGVDANGALDRVGQITNPAWTGLNGVSTTYYAFLDIAADGTCTTGTTTLAPTYRWGGADVTTNNQFTFNIQEMTGKLGNGSAATQTYRVYVGEFVTSGASVVSTITWYALMGRYDSGFTATLPAASAAVSKNSLLGIKPAKVDVIIECTTTDNGYAVGDQIFNYCTGATGTGLTSVQITSNVNTVGFSTGPTNAALSFPKGGGTMTSLTVGSWKYKIVADRGW